MNLTAVSRNMKCSILLKTIFYVCVCLIVATHSMPYTNIIKNMKYIPSHARHRKLQSFPGISINAIDYAALKAIYAAANGPNWFWGNITIASPLEKWNFTAADKAIVDPCFDWFSTVTCNANGDVTLLELFGMGISGPISTQIGTMSNLFGLHLYSNKFTGTIPTELGNIPRLGSLLIHQNQLTGGIPTELGKLTFHLNILDVSFNSLSGNIPTQVGLFTNVSALYLDHNSFSGVIPTQVGGMINLVQLHAENNLLSGTIPTQLGLLTQSSLLYFSHNTITGTIPTQLGAISQLQEFFVDYNSMSGTFPASLCSNSLHTMTVNLVSSGIVCVASCFGINTTFTPLTMPVCTASPTVKPSVQPSTKPSVKPSLSPFRPSSTPTKVPTVQPSYSPTVKPSMAPSNQPVISAKPSVRPTFQPSCSPTVNPSLSPSRRPSIVPSVTPSVSPSTKPSVRPTAQPSVSPTVIPSFRPSVVPSKSPTIAPSVAPVSFPPSIRPSTAVPSRSPTLLPSVTPSMIPSFTPTIAPFAPSIRPSLIPSKSPTVAPSSIPSTKPTAIPTQRPTTAPIGPSLQPTQTPSKSPTAAPTLLPSATPTQTPSTESPTIVPTESPTQHPSASPTKFSTQTLDLRQGFSNVAINDVLSATSSVALMMTKRERSLSHESHEVKLEYLSNTPALQVFIKTVVDTILAALPSCGLTQNDVKINSVKPLSIAQNIIIDYVIIQNALLNATKTIGALRTALNNGQLKSRIHNNSILLNNNAFLNAIPTTLSIYVVDLSPTRSPAEPLIPAVSAAASTSALSMGIFIPIIAAVVAFLVIVFAAFYYFCIRGPRNSEASNVSEPKTPVEKRQQGDKLYFDERYESPDFSQVRVDMSTVYAPAPKVQRRASDGTKTEEYDEDTYGLNFMRLLGSLTAGNFLHPTRTDRYGRDTLVNTIANGYDIQEISSNDHEDTSARQFPRQSVRQSVRQSAVTQSKSNPLNSSISKRFSLFNGENGATS